MINTTNQRKCCAAEQRYKINTKQHKIKGRFLERWLDGPGGRTFDKVIRYSLPHTDKQSVRQTGRQIDTLTGRHINRQKDRQIDRERGRDRQTEGQTERQIDRETESLSYLMMIIVFF